MNEGTGCVARREFLALLLAAAFRQAGKSASIPFPVTFRRPNPYLSLAALADPAADNFACESEAQVIESHLNALFEKKSLPLSTDFNGASPAPMQYRPVAENVWEAQFNPKDRNFENGLNAWVESLGAVRRSSFFVLPDHLVRYEIASKGEYRVGLWKQVWQDGRLAEFSPVEEFLVRLAKPLFSDVTSRVFQNVASFDEQLLKGNIWWRSRVDAATGIDVYGNNGIAAGDMDSDGVDEIYVCQPAGLPNRLYKIPPDGTFIDITERAGIGLLDNTTSALFLDLRNCGQQDLVILTESGPQLFINQGNGMFKHQFGAFRFAKAAQGSFTGMAAADYDRDGRIDLYFCCYVYFSSEDQYRYPVPYHNARNGPPNFLFRNRLNGDGGFFEDVTEECGLNQDNDRYSFAAAWTDLDGDGFPDLYVANDFGRNNLYRNREGRFRDEAEAAGVSNIGPAMSASWADYDGDGRQDLYVSNMWTDAGQRLTAPPQFAAAKEFPDDYRRHAKGNSLFRNLGNGSFEETSLHEHVAMGRWAWSSDAFDFDNDGTPEFYVTCGMLTNPSKQDLNSFFWRQVVAQSPAGADSSTGYENGWNAINQLIREDYSWCGHQPNVFYVKPRAASGHPSRYYDFSGVSGIDFADDSRSFCVTDIDGDGQLDILLKSRLAPQVRVLRNECGEGKPVVVVRLRGVQSNRDGIGARVEVNGRTQWISAGSGFLAQHTKSLYFGVSGSDAMIKITWPSGLKQQFGPIRSGFRYDIEEGREACKIEALRARRLIGARDAPLESKNLPEPSATWLLEPVPLPDRRKGPGFVCLHSGVEPTMHTAAALEFIDVSRSQEDVAALYSLFCSYLFEYRAIGLRLPLLLLIDGECRAHKIYFDIPSEKALGSDFDRMTSSNQSKLALPFGGEYLKQPHRNYFKLGAAFYWAGYKEQALPYLNEQQRRDPDNWKCSNAIGQIQFELGNFREALANLNRTLEARPNYVPALMGAGQAYGKQGRWTEAEKRFRAILAVDPKNADAANQLGLICSHNGRQEEAKRYFELAIEWRRDHAPAINNLGVLYINMGKIDDAVAAFRYGIGVAPDDDELYLNLGRVYIMLGARDKARELMETLVGRKPGDATAGNALKELQTPDKGQN